MPKRLLSFGLACLLVLISSGAHAQQATNAQQTSAQQTDTASALKACVLHQKTSPHEPHIEVTLRNGQKLKGTIDRVEEDYFMLLHNNNVTMIPYAEVAKFKCRQTHSAGSVIGKLALGTGIAIGAILLLGILVARETR